MGVRYSSKSNPSAGQQDSSTAAQQHSSTAGQQDSRTAGQQDSRTAGQQEGDPGRSRAIQGDPGRSRAIQGDLGRSRAIRGDPGRSGAIRGDPGRSGAIRGDLGRSKVLTDRKNSIQSPHGPQKSNPKVVTYRNTFIQKSSRTAKIKSRRYKSRRGPQKIKVVGTVLSPVRVPEQLRSSS